MRRSSITNRLMFTILVILVSASGQAQTCAPGSGPKITLHPGDNVQSIVNSNPCGSTFIFAPGVYANVTIFPLNEATHPLDGDSFIAQNVRTSTQPSILYGATVVSNFTLQGAYWVGTVTTTPAPKSGPNYMCDSKHPACLLPEDLFLDGNLYQRVTALASVATGKWYLDYSTGKVYLTDNPTLHKVEVSTTHFAIYGGNVANVSIRNFIVDKYAPPGGYGAISGVDPSGLVSPSYKWQIQQIEVRNCHGAGIWLGNHMNVYKSFLHNNGEFGAAGTGDAVQFNYNEVSFNNLAGFLPEVGAGVKFTNISGLTVTHNYAHDNLGPGLFDDTGTTSVTYAYNTLQNNRVAGIFHEIGYTADIHDNTITNDGIDTRGTGNWWGAGIMVSNSSNVKVHSNTVVNSQNGIIEQARLRTDCSAPCPLKNVSVYNNKITQDHTILPKRMATGILMMNTYPLGTTVYTTSGNTFGIDPATKAASPNTYTLNPPSDTFFIWLNNSLANSMITYSQWLADGNN